MGGHSITGNISDLRVFQEGHFRVTYSSCISAQIPHLQTTGSDQEDALQRSGHLSFIMWRVATKKQKSAATFRRDSSWLDRDENPVVQ
jgi:hypothetical protein